MNEKEYLDWIKESVKAGIRFRKQFEHTLADAAIEEGILPDPTQLTDRERAVWMEETSELQFPTSITELSHTWEKAKARIESENVNAAAKSNLTPQMRRDPRLLNQVKTTVVHYAHNTLGITQEIAASRMDTTARTYRKYRNDEWLLSDDDFQKVTEKTPKQYWEKATGG